MAAETDIDVDRVRELLDRIVDALDLEADVVVDEDDEEIRGTLVGADLGLVIGRRGQTIDAVQHLAYRIAGRGATRRRQVVIDADGYRARREAALERQADDAADDALDSGRPVSLEPMSALERRHVHEYLRDRGGVETHSEGEEPERRLVVTPLA